MTLMIETQTPPLQADRGGVIRVGGTRVALDTTIHAFNQGYTAEEIANQYPALALADVYAVISYYLNNQTVVDAYRQEQKESAAIVRQKFEAHPEYKMFRERLLTRHQTKNSRRNEAPC